MKIVNERLIKKCQQCGSTTTLIFNPEHIDWPENNPRLIQCYGKDSVVHINRDTNIECLSVLTMWDTRVFTEYLLYGNFL